jgi:hypothetical protein
MAGRGGCRPHDDLTEEYRAIYDLLPLCSRAEEHLPVLGQRPHRPSEPPSNEQLD